MPVLTICRSMMSPIAGTNEPTYRPLLHLPPRGSNTYFSSFRHERYLATAAENGADHARQNHHPSMVLEALRVNEDLDGRTMPSCLISLRVTYIACSLSGQRIGTARQTMCGGLQWVMDMLFRDDGCRVIMHQPASPTILPGFLFPCGYAASSNSSSFSLIVM